MDKGFSVFARINVQRVQLLNVQLVQRLIWHIPMFAT
jgi:hypothetical protein